MTSENQGCLAVILRMFGINLQLPAGSSGRGDLVSVEEHLPYRMRENFLSAAELSFFHVLRSAIGDQYIVATKVRVSDLLYVVQRRGNIKHANRIDRKHVDFVLCDPRTMQPRLVIELDDSSHSRQDRIDRDELIDAAFEAATFPILHVPAQRAYVPETVKQLIEGKVTGAQTTPVPLLVETTISNSVPTCSKCNVAMVERKASKGAHKGKRFWACPSYPECRQILPID